MFKGIFVIYKIHNGQIINYSINKIIWISLF